MKTELKDIFTRLMNVLRNEAVLWTAGLVMLALLNPASDSHISICPLSNLGFTWCPGCGLGRSISFALHGDLPGSLHAHPLGLFAILVLVSRIIVLSSTILIARHNRQSFSHERNLHG